MNYKEELLAIKEDIERERDDNVIHRTLEKLIKIEKEAMYGAKNSNKTARIEKVIADELPKYREKINASAKN